MKGDTQDRLRGKVAVIRGVASRIGAAAAVMTERAMPAICRGNGPHADASAGRRRRFDFVAVAARVPAAERDISELRCGHCSGR